MAGKTIEFRVAMQPDKRRAQPNTYECRLQYLVEAANAIFRVKVETPIQVINQ